MSYARNVLGALAIAIGAANTAAAQSHPIRFFAKGGGYNALTDLNDAGTADFKKLGYNLGGGVGVGINK